ncbi:cyclic nucleotide-binding domain-containing protein [Actinomadura yumaensis]|uniref:cyclic nucleotide-binding domain-containing protein n=1 Tax=Actinomadura yumaensis TaxID=111807 RepID=UPI003613419B
MTTVSPDELRELFLFEDLDDEKLAWLSSYGTVREYPADAIVCAQGDAAEFLYVLLDGEVLMTQLVRDHSVEVSRTSRPGVYGGAVQAYLDDRIEQRYQHTLRATAPSRMFALPARKFAKAVREWFPMATHLLEGNFFGMSRSRQVVEQRERLTALGTITAGLTHELNNPAAAAARASAELGDRLLAAQRRLASSPPRASTAATSARSSGSASASATRPPAPPRARRWRSATPRTSSATGWRSTASRTPGTSRPASSPPGSASRRPRRSRSPPATTCPRPYGGSARSWRSPSSRRRSPRR